MDNHLKKISEFGIAILPQVEAAIIKGMSVSAKDRYQDIKDLCEDLYGGYEEISVPENEEREIKPDLIKENVEDKVNTSAEEIPKSESLASEEAAESEKVSAKENMEAVSQKKEETEKIQQNAEKEVEREANNHIKVIDSKVVEEKSLIHLKEEQEKSDTRKNVTTKKFFNKIAVLILLCIVLAAGAGTYYFHKRQEYTLHAPKIEKNSSTKSEDKTTWDCLWFGSYPKNEITEKDGKIYTTLKNIDNWDENGDAIVEKTKYHKTGKRYFKREPMKWKVIGCENKQVGLMLENFKLDEQTSYEECHEFVEKTLSEEEKKAINDMYYYNLINAVYPGVELNLSSSNLYSYAGTVSSDGTENEVPYNTKTKLVQK